MTVPRTDARVSPRAPDDPVYDVAVTLDNLLALADELCADTVLLCDETVTFTRRHGAGRTCWQGVVGTRGLVRV